MRINPIGQHHYNNNFCGYRNPMDNRKFTEDYNVALRSQISEEKRKIFPEETIKAQIDSYFLEPYKNAESRFSDEFSNNIMDLDLTYDDNTLRGDLILKCNSKDLNHDSNQLPIEISLHRTVQWNVTDNPFGFNDFEFQVYKAEKNLKEQAIIPTLENNQKYDTTYDAVETYNDDDELISVQVGGYELSINRDIKVCGVKNLCTGRSYTQSEKYPNVWKMFDSFDDDLYCVDKLNIYSEPKVAKYVRAKRIEPIIHESHIRFREKQEKLRQNPWLLDYLQ